MNKISKSIIALCIMAWMIMAMGVCGSLDCNTMEVDEAIIYIAVRTSIISCIVGISKVSDLIYKNIRKENKYGYVSTRSSSRCISNHSDFSRFDRVG